MTPYAIPNNSYLVNNALKGAKGPPDLLCRHLFEPGAGCVGGIQNSSLAVYPHTLSTYTEYFMALGPNLWRSLGQCKDQKEKFQ